MLKKKRPHLQRVSEIGGSDFVIEYRGHESPNAAPPVINLPKASPAPIPKAALLKGGHRRVNSDGRRIAHTAKGDMSPTSRTPKLSRAADGNGSFDGQNSDDSLVDPFKSSSGGGRKGLGGAAAASRGGSFRNLKVFSSPEQDSSDVAGQSTGPTSRKKNVLKQFLGRARSNTRDRLVQPDLLADDESEPESENSVVLHEDKPDSNDLRMTPRSRNRAGGMVVPKDTESRVESTLARILVTLEECRAPLEELEAMRLECEALQKEAQASLKSLTAAIDQTTSSSKLAEYEYVAEELVDDPLAPKFKFGDESLLMLDDNLVLMEVKASKSIRSSSVSQTIFLAILALIFGVIVASFLEEMSWSWPGSPSVAVPDHLLRSYRVSFSALSDLEAAFGDGESVAAAFGAEEEEQTQWPHELLLDWSAPFVVLPGARFAIKSALLRRLQQLATAAGFLALYMTQLDFESALAAADVNVDPLTLLLAAAKVTERPASVGKGIYLLVDGWSGSIQVLRDFLNKHALHVALRSERYNTEVKAGIGADESSFDPPLPRFLGSAVNDSFRARATHKLPLARLVLSCDSFTFFTNTLNKWFIPIALHRATGTECVMLVKKMGSDAPSAKVAQDAWVAWLCGVAASIPPPLESNPSDLRRLLTSVTGALNHLISRLGVARQVILGAGYLALCSLASHARSPLLQCADWEELCGMYIECGGGLDVFQNGAHMLDMVSSSLAPFLVEAYPRKMMCYGHVLLEQWLAAQFLATEDAVCDKVLRKAQERFPVFEAVSGPVSSQTLPFVYGPRCTANSLWRGVLHFIGLVTGVYPLAYRLCAWGDNSNVAAYQWLLQLKSQACSPMPKKSASNALRASPSPSLFEYESHGDVGKQVFWTLCRVQAELSVSFPQQDSAHGEDSPFPHFVRAVIANPRHAHDLANALCDPIFPPALTRLHDGLSIGSHMSDITLEAGSARPWAVCYYARVLSSLDVTRLLPLGMSVHQSRALVTSKSTSKRLMAAAFLREHLTNLQASPDSESAATEFFEGLEALLIGASDRSVFVRDECLSIITSMILTVSPAARASKDVRAVLESSLLGLVRLVKEVSATTGSMSPGSPTSSLQQKQAQQNTPHGRLSRAISSLMISGSQLLMNSSPFALIPFLLGAQHVADMVMGGGLVFSLRRVADLAGFPPVNEEVFLWRALAAIVGPETAFEPSDDLLFAIQELGHTQVSLLRLALRQMIVSASAPEPIVRAALRWKEPQMKLEVVSACALTERGADFICEMLEDKLLNAAGAQLLVAGLTAMENSPSRDPRFLVRAAVACHAHVHLQQVLVSTIKADLDQRGWWQRHLAAEYMGPLLQLVREPCSFPLLGEILAALLASQGAVPASLICDIIVKVSAADCENDSELQSLLSILFQVQNICSDDLLDSSFTNVGSLIEAVVNASPLMNQALHHALEVAIVRFLSHLPNHEVVSSFCWKIVSSGGADSGFVNKKTGVALCCTLLSHMAEFGEIQWDLSSLLEQWGTVSAVATPLLTLARALVRRHLVSAEETLRLVLPMVLNSDTTFCPLQRDAALGAAKLAVRELPADSVSWVAPVFVEVEQRAADIRAEEPGIVAALTLVKFALRVADVRDGASPHRYVGEVGSHDSVLISILERSSRSVGGTGDGGPCWNISVVGEALGVIQYLIAIEARVLGEQQEQISGTHLSRYIFPLVSLLLDSTSGTSPELRKAVMRVFRALPRSILLHGLAQIAARQKGTGKWGGMFSSKRKALESSQGDASAVAAVSMTDYLAPVYKYFDRCNHLLDKMVMIEIMSIVTFDKNALPACTAKTETILCDFLRHASGAMSAELSALIQRNHAQRYVPHIWKMLGLSAKSKSVSSKWQSFLRRHYEGRQVESSLSSEHAQMILQTFASSTAGVETALVCRIFGTVFDACYPYNSDPDLLNDVIAAVNAMMAVLEADASLTEQKETCFLMALVLLGKYASLAQMASSHFYEQFRTLLNSLPYGLGRLGWRLLQERAGHLLF